MLDFLPVLEVLLDYEEVDLEMEGEAEVWGVVEDRGGRQEIVIVIILSRVGRRGVPVHTKEC